MMWQQTSRFIILSLGLFQMTSLAAAPLKLPARLPFDATDLEKARAELGDKDAAALSLFFNSQLTVLPDHMNPPGSEQDRNRPKKFYVLPLFQIAADRPNAGGQEIADYAMTLLTEIEALVSRLSFDLPNWQRLEQTTVEVQSQVESLRLILSQGAAADDPRRAALVALEKELTQLQSEKKALQTTYEKQIASIDPNSRDSVTKVVLDGLAKLGVTPDERETLLLQSMQGSDSFKGLASILAKATKFGLFGSRQMIFDASYDEQQKKFISLYKTLRPDVQVAPLPTQTISVKLTASSVGSDQRPESPTRLFLGINTGTKGRCGSSRTCNVMIDYNFPGALAAGIRAGASVAPIVFEAEALVAAPAWSGSVSCRAPDAFWNNPEGWLEALPASCQSEGGLALDGAAAYHVTRQLDSQMRAVLFQTNALSLSEKAKFFQDSESRSSRIESFRLAEAASVSPRPLYKVENSGTLFKLRFDLKAAEPTQKESYMLDALTGFCWKRDMNQPQSPAFITSCQKPLNTSVNADTEAGRSERLCPNRDYKACQELSDKAPADENGLIQEPTDTQQPVVPSWEDIWR